MSDDLKRLAKELYRTINDDSPKMTNSEIDSRLDFLSHHLSPEQQVAIGLEEVRHASPSSRKTRLKMCILGERLYNLNRESENGETVDHAG